MLKKERRKPKTITITISETSDVLKAKFEKPIYNCSLKKITKTVRP